MNPSKSQNRLKNSFIQQLSVQDLIDPALQLKLQKFIKDNTKLKTQK